MLSGKSPTLPSVRVIAAPNSLAASSWALHVAAPGEPSGVSAPGDSLNQPGPGGRIPPAGPYRYYHTLMVLAAISASGHLHPILRQKS